MLTLTRKVGQRILIGNSIQIEVREIRGRQVRISIDAPLGMPVMREELYEMIAAANARAAHAPDPDALERLASRHAPSPTRPVASSPGKTAATRRRPT